MHSPGVTDQLFSLMYADMNRVDVVSISQVIGCEDRLRNDLHYVGWGVKLYSNQTKVLRSVHTARPDETRQFLSGRVGSGGGVNSALQPTETWNQSRVGACQVIEISSINE